jgi:L-fuculokinase
MSQIPAIAVIDVGKTNKKFFLFDEQYKILLEKSIQLPETKDEDGDNCEDVEALTQWIQQNLNSLNQLNELDVKAINFSAYGASFVHIDPQGKAVCPLYNYLKPYPQKIQDELYNDNGGVEKFLISTASPSLGSLNSGLQLLRLKMEQPAIFLEIYRSLHLPQYLSFLASGEMLSDITSVGCHTMLWDFSKDKYHDWVYREGLGEKLAPIYPSDKVMSKSYNGKKLFVGTGLHDSSAALIPYLSYFSEPFVLISTGTWCISLNPFNQLPLTKDELKNDCLCYLDYHGKAVKASRLFAGYEHEQQTKRIADQFQLQPEFYKELRFDPAISDRIARSDKESHRNSFSANATEAYYRLLNHLVQQQMVSTKLVLQNSEVKRIFVDGGFGRNDIYMNLLAASFPEVEVYTATVAQATALGAAMAIHEEWNSKPLPADVINMKYYSTTQDII